jgi:hypothetical protein
MTDPDGRDVIVVVGLTNKGDQFAAVGTKLAGQLTARGVPVQVVNLGNARIEGSVPSIDAAVQRIESSGKKVSGVAMVGHGAAGAVATDPKDPGHATTSVKSLADSAHVQKGGAVVGATCLTFGPGSALERRELDEAGISGAGFGTRIGFSPTGDLEVPYKSGSYIPPADVVPPISSGPESGKSIGDILAGAERRINPPPPPPRTPVPPSSRR